MGYASNGFCFGTPDAAAAYACARDFPVVSVMVDGSGNPASVVVECIGTTGNVLSLQRDVNGTVQGTSTLALTSVDCDVTEFLTYHPFSMDAATGALLAGAVATTWFVGWGIRVAVRALDLGGSGSAGSSDE